MRKKPLIIGIAILIALVAMLTNPTEEKHKSKVKSIVETQIQKSVMNELNDIDNGSENVAQDASILLGNVMMEQLVNSMVTCTDYILFSTTNIVWGGESKTIGFGLFGHVFISSKVEKLLESEFIKRF
jgi:hypothetical protein